MARRGTRHVPGGEQLPLFSLPPPPLPESPSGLRPSPADPPGLLLGTCSFTHESWEGSFFPVGLPLSRRLSYYSSFFNTVEIDASFYRVPSRETVRRWKEETGALFNFALKAPRSLTHEAALSLDDRAARTDWEALLDVLAAELPGRSALLIQLGPSLSPRRVEALEKVLKTLPSGLPTAVEFRDPAWDSHAINERLASFGVARAFTDAYSDPSRRVRRDPLGPAFTETAPFLYLRLLGNLSTKYESGTGLLRHRYDRIQFPNPEDRQFWARLAARALERGKTVWLLVNNHHEGFSPMTAACLRSEILQILEK